MRISERIFYFICAAVICIFSNFSILVKAQERTKTVSIQEATISYKSRIEPPDSADPPKILELPKFQYPESARQKGVEGKMKVSLTLAKDGTVQDVFVEENLPHGVTDAITDEIKRLRFQPARKNGEPVDAKMFFDFVVSAVYSETDRNVSKPKIIEKPGAVYPGNQKALRGRALVSVVFLADGSVEVLGVRSSLPEEFAQAAVDAAKKIKFEPAVHRATNQKVSQRMTVEYNFRR